MSALQRISVELDDMPKYFYHPLKINRINQSFGQNLACVDNATGTKTIYCDGHNPPKGYRSVYSQMLGHNGIDYFATRWTQVYASREGTVIEVETEEARGLGIGILHEFKIDPYTREELTKEQVRAREKAGLDVETVYYKTRYWHLIAMDVHIGDKVWTGSLIGYADNTGYSSGDHLHFEIKRTDRRGNTLDNNNGYFGAVDPLPLMFDDCAVDINLARKAIELAAQAVDKLADKLRGR